MCVVWWGWRGGTFSTARTLALHILTTLVRVCVRGGVWVPGNPSHWTHTRPTLWGLKKQQYVCMCVRTCVATGLRLELCKPLGARGGGASECVFELVSMLCVLFCVCGRERRQISKNARWEASPYFQAGDGKQPLGSAGLKQLEKFVEGAQRGYTAPRPQRSAGKGKL